MTGPTRLLALLEEDVASCRDCPLCTTRTLPVFGRGDPYAPILLVGEAPGETEDLTGIPFVGRAGKLLDEMIDESALGPHYICNSVKCRPPGNRVPTAGEIKACRGFLSAQVEIVSPKVIVVLGRTAAKALGVEGRLHQVGWRGTQISSAHTPFQVPMIVTFHPAYVLRSPGSRWFVLDDLRRAKRLTVE